MGNNSTINIPLGHIGQMLIDKKISFYCRKFLEEDIEDYIIEEALLLPKSSAITLNIILPQDEISRGEELKKAIHKHFDYRRRRSNLKLKNTLRLGWKSLLIGFLFLIIMYVLIEALNYFFAESRVSPTIRELFLILGWVALWRPAELLLYEWRPIKRDSDLFYKLQHSKVKIGTDGQVAG